MKVQDTITLTIVFIMILIFFLIIFSTGSTRVRTVYNLWGIISYENWQIIQILFGLTVCIIIIMKLIN
jgi:hypothetical protein